jgi:hypothetical protein
VCCIAPLQLSVLISPSPRQHAPAPAPPLLHLPPSRMPLSAAFSTRKGPTMRRQTSDMGWHSPWASRWMSPKARPPPAARPTSLPALPPNASMLTLRVTRCQPAVPLHLGVLQPQLPVPVLHTLTTTPWTIILPKALSPIRPLAVPPCLWPHHRNRLPQPLDWATPAMGWSCRTHDYPFGGQVPKISNPLIFGRQVLSKFC